MDIHLGLNKDIDKAREIIHQSLPDKNIKIKEIEYDSRSYFNIASVGYRHSKDFDDRITEIILNLILEIYSENLINRYVYMNFKTFKSIEKEEISELSRRALLNKGNFIVEKQYISNQIKRYVQDTSTLSIDGFILFRLKELDLLISLSVDKGIEEFTARREYKDFINILKYFVDIQEPKYSFINIFFESNDFILLDEKNQEIDKNYFEDIIYQIEDESISSDDILISTLIVLAPKSLILHLNDKSKNSDIIRVITDVFEDRVYFCLGCEKCREKVKIDYTK